MSRRGDDKEMRLQQEDERSKSEDARKSFRTFFKPFGAYRQEMLE